jgi:hypothetical protein
VGADLAVLIHHFIKKTAGAVMFNQPFYRLQFSLGGHFETIHLSRANTVIFSNALKIQ